MCLFDASHSFSTTFSFLSSKAFFSIWLSDFVCSLRVVVRSSPDGSGSAFSNMSAICVMVRCASLRVALCDLFHSLNLRMCFPMILLFLRMGRVLMKSAGNDDLVS